jgi:hypothetical protein
MILTLDTLGERYGLLPSEVLARGNTLDIMIMDTSLTYRDYQQRKAQGKVATDYTTEELQSMLNKTRGKS